jgi:selenide,water dikinase
VLAGGSEDEKRQAIIGMRTLNRAASETLQSMFGDVHAVTDVTGYGLAGHGWEMAQRSDARIVVPTDELPVYAGAREAATAGTRTGGDPRNRDYLAGHLDTSTAPEGEALCFDPQTSGGLLAAVAPDAARELEAAGWWRIGSVEAGDPQLVLR